MIVIKNRCLKLKIFYAFQNYKIDFNFYRGKLEEILNVYINSNSQK